MFLFTSEEYMDMIESYIECRKNTRAAKALYMDKFPERRQPGHMTFVRAFNKSRQTGTFPNGKTIGRTKNATGEQHSVAVLAAVNYNPRTSIRSIVSDLDISYGSVQTILARNKYKAYKLNLVQQLHCGDDERRLHFILEKFMTLYEDDPTVLRRILWSDECNFSNSGLVNRHNCHYWSDENPHWMRETNCQVKWSTNVWCGIIDNQIVGPYFYNGILTGVRYLNFIQNELPQLLENIPLNTRQSMWFHQDGAPPHNSGIVTNYLNDTYPARWMGTNGPICWPARSPDLTPLDWFLWGYLKSIVYETQSRNVEELRQKISDACRAVTPATLRKVTGSTLLQRFQKCVECNGLQFEQYL